jgi:RNA polymerase sigma-70 factor (ECF subfamily)
VWNSSGSKGAREIDSATGKIDLKMAANNHDMRDADIVRCILDGQTKAFEILLHRYQRFVFKIVSGRLPPEVVAETAHKIFVSSYQSLPKYNLRKPFKTWLTGIAINICADHWRKHYRNPEIRMSDLSDEHREWLENIDSNQAKAEFDITESGKEARELLNWAMADLAPKDRTVLMLVHFDGYSVKEAAEILGWTSVNVRVRAHRSRERLRKKITNALAGGSGHEKHEASHPEN